ncbi:Wzz/FepE/Etk N-terminal domain-containing protein [Shewanella algae]|uniref:Wzz/FepE/Etk N-terminal domain-containing protein n=1 Tax=Shewanella algae TaxID=38313 RepID=UPI001BEF437C|nr:Wzz/FepE/Etk N-terminal domain-containing protein [Shewanella algae]BCV40199.1 LPS biosynthesis protein [Shewanella algae]
MTSQITPQQHPDAQFAANTIRDDEIDLRELFSVIWQSKWLITGITILFTIGSVIITLMMPNIYKSQALLAPAVEENGGGGLAALASQFGGLASIAGINLGGKGGTDKTLLAMEVAKSHQFISNFIKKHQILPDLMAVSKWDIVNNKIEYNPELYDANSQKWLRKVSFPFSPEPSMQEAYKEFRKIFAIDESKDTGMVKVSIEHQSPYIAKQWVDWLVADLNKEMKERDVFEATRSTDFLNKQISMTNVADIRAILYKLVEEQAKTIMFAEVRDEYVFKTIDPALIPEEKIKPKRALIVVFGTMLGLILSVLVMAIVHFVRKR